MPLKDGRRGRFNESPVLVFSSIIHLQKLILSFTKSQTEKSKLNISPSQRQRSHSSSAIYFFSLSRGVEREMALRYITLADPFTVIWTLLTV